MKAKIQDRNEWAKQRYKLFNEKIDSFKGHKAFSSWLRQYADDAIKWNEMSGYFMIKAEDFIKRIEKCHLNISEIGLTGKISLSGNLSTDKTMVSIRKKRG